MDKTRKLISEEFYRRLDIFVGGNLQDVCTEEEFYKVFEDVFQNYLILLATIIE